MPFKTGFMILKLLILNVRNKTLVIFFQIFTFANLLVRILIVIVEIFIKNYSILNLQLSKFEIQNLNLANFHEDTNNYKIDLKIG